MVCPISCTSSIIWWRRVYAKWATKSHAEKERPGLHACMLIRSLRRSSHACSGALSFSLSSRLHPNRRQLRAGKEYFLLLWHQDEGELLESTTPPGHETRAGGDGEVTSPVRQSPRPCTCRAPALQACEHATTPTRPPPSLHTARRVQTRW